MTSFVCCRCPRNNPRRIAGVALITVLLIVFLTSTAAISLAVLQQRAIRRTTVLDHQQQAYLYTLGAEQEAVILLIRDLQAGTKGRVGLDWTDLPMTIPVEGGMVTARIRDRQGCFNLNNLWQLAQSTDTPQLGPSATTENEKKSADPTNLKQSTVLKDKEKRVEKDKVKAKAQINKAQVKWLERILERLELKPEVAQAIADWVDPDADPLFPGGAEDSDYSALDPPYRAANGPFLSVSELRLMKGIDRESYDKLAPHVCALPPGVGMNVNTADAFILATLSDNLKTEDVARLLEDRPEEGYKDVDTFLNATHITLDATMKSNLQTESQYLLLHVKAEVGDGRAALYSTLYQEGENVRVVQHAFSDPH